MHNSSANRNFSKLSQPKSLVAFFSSIAVLLSAVGSIQCGGATSEPIQSTTNASSTASISVTSSAAVSSASQSKNATKPTSAPAQQNVEAAGLKGVEMITGGASSTEALPMIIALHGLGDNPSNFIRIFSGYTQKARVIALQAPDSHGSGFSWFPTRVEAGAPKVHAEGIQKSADRVSKAIAELIQAKPTVNKPIVTGFSQGGMLSFTIAIEHPNDLKIAIPLSGWLPPAIVPQSKNKNATYPPIIALHGDADTMLPIAPTRESVAQLKKLGFDVVLHEYPGVAHTITPAMRTELFALITQNVSATQSQ